MSITIIEAGTKMVKRADGKWHPANSDEQADWRICADFDPATAQDEQTFVFAPNIRLMPYSDEPQKVGKFELIPASDIRCE